MEQSASFYEFVGFQAPQVPEPADLADLRINVLNTAILLDFDGTLVDIAARPDAIRYTPADGRLLSSLMQGFHGAVAVVTGRDLADISYYLGGFAGTVSGGHGAQIRRDGEIVTQAEFDAERLEHIKNAVTEFAVIDPRVILEEKSTGMVLHFRQNPEVESLVRTFAECLLSGCDDFELQPAKMAFEIKPKNISKAAAIEQILQQPEFAGRVPLYAGDDTTDETAFACVNDMGGLSIKIGAGPTCAQYRAESPAVLKRWLSATLSKRRN
ncbi:trehalose-phosphatase [Pseudohoeflea coraliihabitans]|uniref:Trehalose 6-phosphate phosphatase n=1 Tax=Pseudohoeflea coraliihabitans TaxID=2860393 RepID=A0ABS6WRL4_9HYPH|nr:trehalose-phosphatase [Pseudohoeflea sp. DP4N28-3]MBW3098619.1 trehalose-phosphatase [Pseudohoeflea sp. DP4N28-3]